MFYRQNIFWALLTAMLLVGCGSLVPAVAQAGFITDAKDRIAAPSKAGLPESAELARLVQKIEIEQSRFTSP